jgi:hypothetical protein
MAKNEPILNTACPRCGLQSKMEVDLDLKVSSNVTVLICPDEDCDHRFAKNQSVKLSSSLVLEAADTMEILGGYSSLGEFVRECIRIRTSSVQHNHTVAAFGDFLGAIADDPETWAKIFSNLDEEKE